MNRKEPQDEFGELAMSEIAATAAVSELEIVQDRVNSRLTTLRQKTAESIKFWQRVRKQLVKRIGELSKWPPSLAEDARSTSRSLASFVDRLERQLRRALLRKVVRRALMVLLLVVLPLIVLILLLRIFL